MLQKLNSANYIKKSAEQNLVLICIERKDGRCLKMAKNIKEFATFATT